MTSRPKLVSGTSTAGWSFKYDAWNRLVLVQVTPSGGSASTRAAYGYYGTHWRAWRVADNNADTVVDQANTYYYDASWRLLEERIDEGHTPDSGWLAAAPAQPASIPTDSITQRVWGLEYIDELIYFHTDGPVITGAEQEGESEGAPTITPADGDFANAKGYYALVDRLYSVIGVADASNGDLVERIRYTPYGVARAIDPAQAASWGDVNGDGKIDAYDRDAASSAVGGTLNATTSPYDPDADFNRDNTVSFAEFNLVLGNFGQSYATLAEGQLSRQTIANTVGYAGYIFDSATELYCVRQRWLDPSKGCWTSRDPAGYVDGMNVYAYGRGAATKYTDPSGLACTPWRANGGPEFSYRTQTIQRRVWSGFYTYDLEILGYRFGKRPDLFWVSEEAEYELKIGVAYVAELHVAGTRADTGEPDSAFAFRYHGFIPWGFRWVRDHWWHDYSDPFTPIKWVPDLNKIGNVGWAQCRRRVKVRQECVRECSKVYGVDGGPCGFKIDQRDWSERKVVEAEYIAEGWFMATDGIPAYVCDTEAAEKAIRTRVGRSPLCQ